MVHRQLDLAVAVLPIQRIGGREGGQSRLQRAFRHNYTMLPANVKPCNLLERGAEQARGIGRVEKDEVELLPRAEVTHRVAAADARAVRQAAQLEVVLHKAHRVRPPIDKHRRGRPTRERLDAELARPREEVEHAPPLDIKLDDGKQALFDLVGRGTGLHARQFLQSSAPGRPGNHSHSFTRGGRSTRKSQDFPPAPPPASPLSFGWSSQSPAPYRICGTMPARGSSDPGTGRR